MAQTKVIKQIEVIHGDRGDWLKVHFEDDKTTNFFQPEHQAVVREVGEGNAITYEVEKKDKFWNVVSVRPANLPKETVRAAVIQAGGVPIKDDSPIFPMENNGAARGMAVKEVGDLIRASNEKELKFVALVFGDKASPLIEWYRGQILTIAGLK